MDGGGYIMVMVWMNGGRETLQKLQHFIASKIHHTVSGRCVKTFKAVSSRRKDKAFQKLQVYSVPFFILTIGVFERDA